MSRKSTKRAAARNSQLKALKMELDVKEAVKAALAALGNPNPGLDIQHVAWCAVVYSVGYVDSIAVQSMAFEIVRDTGTHPFLANILASICVGIAKTHGNPQAVIRYLRTGARRPRLTPGFLGLVSDMRTPHELRMMLASRKAA